MLQHLPHTEHVVTGETAVAPWCKIAEAEFGGCACLDGGNTAGDFACEELVPAPGAFVVERDTAAGEQVVDLPVVHRDPMRVRLRCCVRRAWLEGRRLVLG